jgi:hypothetical protein
VPEYILHIKFPFPACQAVEIAALLANMVVGAAVFLGNRGGWQEKWQGKWHSICVMRPGRLLRAHVL